MTHPTHEQQVFVLHQIRHWVLGRYALFRALNAGYWLREPRRFKDERREVPLGVESAWPDFVYGEKPKGREMSAVLPAFLSGSSSAPRPQ